MGITVTSGREGGSLGAVEHYTKKAVNYDWNYRINRESAPAESYIVQKIEKKSTTLKAALINRISSDTVSSSFSTTLCISETEGRRGMLHS